VLATRQDRGIRVAGARRANSLTSVSIREGSHPQPVANNIMHNNYIDDANGYWGGPGMPEKSPLINNNTMNNDTFGASVNQLYFQWGPINASNLTQSRAIPEEQTGTTENLPAGVGNGGTPP
jgi:hypothetical protein